jgi:hypothetical protein
MLCIRDKEEIRLFLFAIFNGTNTIVPVDCKANRKAFLKLMAGRLIKLTAVAGGVMFCLKECAIFFP